MSNHTRCSRLSSSTVINIYFTKKEGEVMQQKVQLRRLPTDANPSKRWMTFTVGEWKEVMKAAVNVSKALKNNYRGESLTFTVTDDITLKMAAFKERVYVGYHKKKPHTKNIINLSLYEWEAFEREMPYFAQRFEVPEALEAAPEGEGGHPDETAVEHSVTPMVQQYRWGLCSLYDG
jgi:hypothetical protein